MLIDDIKAFKFSSNLEPKVILKKTSGEIDGVLEESHNEEIQSNVIGVDTFTFGYPKDGFYSEKIKVGKTIELLIRQDTKEQDGATEEYFFPEFIRENLYITNIKKSESDKNLINVTCKSNYILLGQKVVQGFSGIKKLYRTDIELALFTPNMIENGVQYSTYEEYENSGLLNYIFKLCPDWSISNVDSQSAGLYREVDFQEDSVLSILNSFIIENYEVIPQFDTINKTVSFITIGDLGEDNGLIISNKQIAKEIATTIDTSDWVTKLYVYGSEGITVAPINPTGKDYILNLGYIKDIEFMSQDLIDRIDAYELKIETEEPNFEILLSELGVLQSELSSLIDEKDDAENTLSELQTELSATIVQYANSDEVPLRTTEDIVNDINALQKEIGNKVTEVKDIGATSNEIVTLDETYRGDLEVYLVDINYARLGEVGTDYSFNGVDTISGIDGTVYQKVVVIYNANYISPTIEDRITAKEDEIDSKYDEIYALREEIDAENFFTTDEFKDLQVFIREKVYRNENIYDREELYEKGLEVLNKINSPSVTIDIDSTDFLNSLDFIGKWEKLDIGNIVTIKSELLPNNSIKIRLVGFNWSISNNKLSLKLSSSNTLNDDTFELEDLLSRANSAATNISINASKYGAYVDSGERNELNDYINNTLDLAAQRAVAGKNQNVQIDDTGILLANEVEDGQKLKMLNNLIVLTKDNFKTANVAISPDGVVAERLIGEVILGNELRIITSSQDFIIDQNGLKTTRSDLTSQSIITSEEFKLQKGDGLGSYEDIFYVDSNGGLILKGQITIQGGSTGVSSFDDAGALATKDSVDITNSLEVLNAGSLATKNSVDMSTAEVINKIADNIQESVTRKWASESGADVTGNNTAQSIFNQGALAVLDAISETHITDNAVTTPKLVSGAVITSKLAAGAVVADKISVSDLSAINADLGTITAGHITGVTAEFGSNGKVVITPSFRGSIQFEDDLDNLLGSIESSSLFSSIDISTESGVRLDLSAESADVRISTAFSGDVRIYSASSNAVEIQPFGALATYRGLEIINNAGNGLDKSGSTLLIDPSEIAGFGLREDGSQNLEINDNEVAITGSSQTIKFQVVGGNLEYSLNGGSFTALQNL